MTAASVSARARTARLTAIVAAVIGALAAAVLVPLGAAAAPVALSGVVVNASGTALGSLTISAYDATTLDGALLGTAKTNASGAYSFPSLPAGDYRLKFPKTSTTYAQYLGGSTDPLEAEVVTLENGGGNSSYLRIALSASGALAGKVTKAGGVVIAGAAVKVYGDDGSGDWSVVASTTTNTSGKYSVTGLEPAPYRVQITAPGASPKYGTQFSGGSGSLETATDQIVVASSTTTCNFVLNTASKITGTVLGHPDGVSTEPVSNTLVVPVRALGSAFNDGVEELTAFATHSNAAGVYTITGLPAGTYTLRFSPSQADADLPTSGIRYGSGYLDTVTGLADANFLHLSVGQTLTENIDLHPRGRVEGVVTDQFGDPLANARVTLDDEDALIDDGLHTPRSVLTNELGQYEFTGVGMGSYRVLFGAFEDQDPDDGVAEQTGYLRTRHAAFTITPGMTKVDNAQLQPRDPLGLHVTLATVIEMSGGTDVGDNVYVAQQSVWTGGAQPTPTMTFQWYRGDWKIPGATEQSYVLRPGDYGSSVSLKVTAYDWAAGWGTETVTLPGTVGVGAAPHMSQAPGVVGTLAVGETVTIDPGIWRVRGLVGDYIELREPGIAFQYSWETGAGSSWTEVGTGTSHLISAADIDNGGQLRIHVTGTRFGYQDVDYWYGPVLLHTGEFELLTEPKLTKTSTKLTLSPGTWFPTPEAVEVQWLVHNNDGSSTVVNGSTLPLAGHAGKYIEVSYHPVAAHVAGDTTWKTAQAGAAPKPVGSTSLGTPRVGSTTLAPDFTWTPGGSTLAFTWQYLSGTKWKTIAGETLNTYVPTANLLGKKLRVVTTATLSGYAKATKTSASATILSGLAASEDPGDVASIVGPVGVNRELTVYPGTWAPAATAYAYQWKYNADGNPAGPFTKISGATAASYTPPLSLKTKHLFVDLSVKRTGHTTAVKTLAAGEITQGPLANTVAPKVTRTGNLLTIASNGTWSPAAETFEYQWWRYQADGTPVFVFDGSSLDISAWPNARIDVKVTAKAAGYFDGEKQVVANVGALVPAGTVQLFGDGKIDTSLFAALPGFLVDSYDRTIAYQWQYYSTSTSKWVAIPGATSNSYLPTGASLVGKKVRALVTATAPGFAKLSMPSDEVTLALGVEPEPGVAPNAPAFDQAGPSVGTKDTFFPGTWNTNGITFSYQWETSPTGSAPWTKITGATTRSYTPKESQLGSTLRILVTAKVPGHLTAVEPFEAGVVTQGSLIATTPPKVTKDGSKLTVSTGTWNASGAAFAYYWDRVDPLTGTTQMVSMTKSYTLTPADAGKQLRVLVQATRANYFSGSYQLDAQLGAAPVPVGPAGVTGTREVGETLTAEVSGWSVMSPNLTPHWYRNGVSIPGAGDFAYTTTAEDLGKTLTVKILAVRPGHKSGTVTLSAGLILSPDAVTNVSLPAIEGTDGDGVRVGTKLTATSGVWAPSGYTLSYQWVRNGTDIPGATTKSYTPTFDDLANDIWVEVTATHPLYDANVARSYGYLVVWGEAPTLVTPTDWGFAGISGSGALNAALTSKAVTWSVPATVRYQWEYASDGLNFFPIPGADAASYTPKVADGVAAGGSVRLALIPTRTGHLAGYWTSNAIELF